MITFDVNSIRAHDYSGSAHDFLMDLKTRLLRAREKSKLTQSELARRCGVRSQTINRLESGDSKQFSSELLFKAASVMHVNAEWLATGKGAMEPIGKMDLPPDVAEAVQLMLRMDERGRNAVLILARSQAAACETPSKANGVQ